MQLQQSIKNVFVQLSASLQQLTQEQYVFKSQTLSNATIGQHVRHIIEMFVCLVDGYETGMVNYENRKRDGRIETNKEVALAMLHDIYNNINKENKPMVMGATYHEDSSALIYFDTNFYREIAYNLEHTIHHMALIKVGIQEVSEIEIPDEFGVASSTIKYRKECAQ